LGNYRSKLDIIADILRVASGYAKKTQIMYQANLSYAIMQKYLAEMIGASLISFEDETRSYVLTDKGSAFLDAYQEYTKTSMYLEKGLKAFRTRKSTLEKLCATNHQ
jgi:predicted transcriptional regulator